MTKPANKKRGEVAVPELGDGVFLRFTVDALERLETTYDDKEHGWLINVLEGLSGNKVSIIKVCVECAIVDGAEPDWSIISDLNTPYSMDGLAAKILDALFLILYKRTFAEQKEHEEKKQMEELSERMKAVNSDPHLAALVSLEQSGRLATSPDSDQTKFAA